MTTAFSGFSQASSLTALIAKAPLPSPRQPIELTDPVTGQKITFPIRLSNAEGILGKPIRFKGPDGKIIEGLLVKSSDTEGHYEIQFGRDAYNRLLNFWKLNENGIVIQRKVNPFKDIDPQLLLRRDRAYPGGPPLLSHEIDLDITKRKK